MERLGIKNVRTFANKPYLEVWDTFMTRVAAARDVEQSRKVLREAEIESSIKWSRQNLDDYDIKQSSQNDKTFDKPQKSNYNHQLNDLVDDLGKLTITVNQLFEQVKMNGPRKMEEKEKGNRTRKTRFNVNAMAQTPYYEEDQSDQYSSDSDIEYVSVNAIRRQDATCWYCSSIGHFLSDCKLRTYDEACKFFKWDESGQLGQLGPWQVTVPP